MAALAGDAEVEGPKLMSKKRTFVKDGVFNTELTEFLAKELADAGFAGVEVRRAPTRTDVVIRVTKPGDVIGDKGRRVRELTGAIRQRYNLSEKELELYAERVEYRGLSAEAQAESVKFKLLEGLAVRRAAYGVLRSVLEEGAHGCEVIVSGKLRGQRAKAMKFRQGYMIKTGDAARHYVRTAVRHVLLRQGALGVKVSIMLPHDPEGVKGPRQLISDHVSIHPCKEDPLAVPNVPMVPGGRPGFAPSAAVPPPHAAAAPQQQYGEQRY